jgi:UDP-glucose 4-epimerase
LTIPGIRTVSAATILGGAGFIGRHLVDELVGSGVRVTSIDRDPRQRLNDSGAASIQADAATGDHALSHHFRTAEIDAVFVAVGTGLVPRSLDHPQADLQSNVLPLLASLELLRERAAPPVVVHFSSAAVYGEARSEPMSESHPLEPLSPYGVSKLAAERYTRLYHVLYGLPTLSLRLFSVFGPGQRKLVVHDLLTRVLAGEDPLVVAGGSEVTRDYVFATDVARCAHHLAKAAPATGEAYNLCSGIGTTLRELVEAMQAACGTTAEVEFTGTVREGDPQRFVGDGSAGRALGAGCDSALRVGLAATVDWLRRT